MTDKPRQVTPPKHFPAALRAWFDEHVEEFALDLSEIQVLEAMGDTWIEYVGLRKALAAAGSYVYLDRFQTPRERPELAAMNRCRITFARLRRELALPIEEPADVRLPRTTGAKN